MRKYRKLTPEMILFIRIHGYEDLKPGWYKTGKVRDEPTETDILLEIDIDGNKTWYQNNELHREDGPAFEHYAGSKIWYKHGLLHRKGGPANVGFVKSEWWENGVFLKEEWHR